jgi:hypothetical protein
MAFRTHCDWCGELLYEQDHAEMRVTINRIEGMPSELERRWAQEVRATRHFCVGSLPDKDSYDRMGLEVPKSHDTHSCYARAIAAITGTETEAPSMGMEWKLVPMSESPRFRGTQIVLGTTPLTVLCLKVSTERTLEAAGILTAEHAADIRQRGGMPWGLGPRRALELDKALLDHGFLGRVKPACDDAEPTPPVIPVTGGDE